MRIVCHLKLVNQMSTARNDHMNLYKRAPLFLVRKAIQFIFYPWNDEKPIKSVRWDIFFHSTIVFLPNQCIDGPLGVCDLGGNAYGPNIATSVHLRFYNVDMNNAAINKIKRNWWVVSNSIVVQKTVPSTYFGVIQIPGIYAGLQQLKDVECGKNFKGI